MKASRIKMNLVAALAVSGLTMIGCGSSNSTPAAGVDLSAAGKTATGANLKCASSGQNAWQPTAPRPSLR